MPCGAVRCGAVRCGAVRCSAVRCGLACSLRFGGAAASGTPPPPPHLHVHASPLRSTTVCRNACLVYSDCVSGAGVGVDLTPMTTACPDGRLRARKLCARLSWKANVTVPKKKKKKSTTQNNNGRYSYVLTATRVVSQRRYTEISFRCTFVFVFVFVLCSLFFFLFSLFFVFAFSFVFLFCFLFCPAASV